MKFYLIRHGIAEKSEIKPDLERELTPKGKEKLKKTYKKISKRFKKPDLILCSYAIRSSHTGKILKKIWKVSILINHENLNPSASIDDYISVLKEYINTENLNTEEYRIALVTHEPDLSNFANYLLNNSIEYDEIEKKLKIVSSHQFFNFKLKKGSLMIIDWNGKNGTLEFYATPSMLKRL